MYYAFRVYVKVKHKTITQGMGEQNWESRVIMSLPKHEIA